MGTGSPRRAALLGPSLLEVGTSARPVPPSWVEDLGLAVAAPNDVSSPSPLSVRMALKGRRQSRLWSSQPPH